MNPRLLALYGLKWNPFAPGVPTEALHVTSPIDSFRRRVWQLAAEGGFALITGAPGTGKSATLRILAEHLAQQRNLTLGLITRPQAHLGDYYRVWPPCRPFVASGQPKRWPSIPLPPSDAPRRAPIRRPQPRG
jgi:hypothetical protein